MADKKGIIYLLTNPAMPNLVKIGRIESDSIDTLKSRVSALYNTSVPYHFDIVHAVRVDDYAKEIRLHDAFDDERANPRREFFNMSPETENKQGTLKKLKILMDLIGNPIDPQEWKSVRERDSDISEEELKAHDNAEREQKRRAPFTFEVVNIDEGEVLTFSKDSTIAAKVVGSNVIEYEGTKMSLSAAADKILKEKFGGQSKAGYAGTLYWEYEGEILDARRKRLENESE